MQARIAAARALTHHPRIDVTGLEAVINTRYTYDTIKWLVARCPGVHFVWIMGADNLRSFHRWQKWRGIAKLVPFAVVDRLGPSLYAAASPAGQALGAARIPEHDAATLPFRKPPAWVFLHGLKVAIVVDGAARLAGNVRQKAGKKSKNKSKNKASKPKQATKKRGISRNKKKNRTAKTRRRKTGKKRTK